MENLQTYDLTQSGQEVQDILDRVDADRAYDPADYSGMGRVILMKNMVNGVNTLTQDMFYKGEPGARVPNTNTVFVIRYDFDLNGQSITIPENCVLEFDGGSVGNGELVGQNTVIEAGLVKIFGTDVTISGSWNVNEAYPEWFGAVGDGITDCKTAIQQSAKINGCIKFNKGTYKVSTGVNTTFNDYVEIRGCGKESIIYADSVSPQNASPNYNLMFKCLNGCHISNLSFHSVSDQIPKQWYIAAGEQAENYPFRSSNISAIQATGNCLVENCFFLHVGCVRFNNADATIRNCTALVSGQFVFTNSSTVYIVNNNVCMEHLYQYYHYLYSYFDSTTYSIGNHITNEDVAFDIYHLFRSGNNLDQPTQYLNVVNDYIECNTQYIIQNYKSFSFFKDCVIKQSYNIDSAYSYDNNPRIVHNGTLVSTVFENCHFDVDVVEGHTKESTITSFVSCIINATNRGYLFTNNVSVTGCIINKNGRVADGENNMYISNNKINCDVLYRNDTVSATDVVIKMNHIECLGNGENDYMIYAPNAFMQIKIKDNVFENISKILYSTPTFDNYDNFQNNRIIGISILGLLADAPDVNHGGYIGFEYFATNINKMIISTQDGYKDLNGYSPIKLMGAHSSMPSASDETQNGRCYIDSSHCRPYWQIKGVWTDALGHAMNKRHGTTRPVCGSTPEDIYSGNDIGFLFFDQNLNKPIFAKSTNSTTTEVAWVDATGANADVKHAGTWAQRPTTTSDIYEGFMYMLNDGTSHFPLYAHINSSTIEWYKADGTRYTGS